MQGPTSQSAGSATEADRGTVRRSWPAILLDLTKARITIATTVVTGTGYVLFAGRFELEMLVPMAGVFLVACGAAALNQVQEWRSDAKMLRTRARPIPSGELTPHQALGLSLLLIAAGLNVLAAVDHNALVVVSLGALAVVWYNGLYLYLKRATAFAAVPGALVGAIPPVLGWCAAGGVWHDRQILEVAFFFFVWQIPHFWLLAQVYGEEYERAGLPLPNRLFSADQFRNVTSVWILTVAVCGLVLAVVQRLDAPWNLLALGASLALVAATLVRRHERGRAVAVALFRRINLYALTILMLLVANACIRP